MRVAHVRRSAHARRSPAAWQVARQTVLFTLALLVGGWLAVRLRVVLVHVLLAAILAAGMAPLVDRIAGPAAAGAAPGGAVPQRKRALPRAAVVLGLYLLLAAALALGAALVLPSVVADTEDLVAGLPDYAARLQGWVAALPPSPPFAVPQEALQGVLQRLLSDMTQLTRLLNQTVLVVRLVIGLLGGALDVVVVLVLALYMTHDQARLRQYLTRLLPPPYRQRVDRLAVQIGRRLADWLLGQIALSAIVGLLCLAGLQLLGVRYALLLAFIAALGEAVPMVGPIVSAIPAVAVALLQSPEQALLVTLLYVVVQQLENNLIVPKVMARAVALHPLAVMLALLAGAELLGIAGAVLAVPVTASVTVVLDELRSPAPRRRQPRPRRQSPGAPAVPPPEAVVLPRSPLRVER